MLVQKDKIDVTYNNPFVEPFNIYHAVVLNQVFKDIEEDYEDFLGGSTLQLVRYSMQQEEQPDRREVPQGATGGPVQVQLSSRS